MDVVCASQKLKQKWYMRRSHALSDGISKASKELTSILLILLIFPCPQLVERPHLLDGGLVQLDDIARLDIAALVLLQQLERIANLQQLPLDGPLIRVYGQLMARRICHLCVIFRMESSVLYACV